MYHNQSHCSQQCGHLNHLDEKIKTSVKVKPWIFWTFALMRPRIMSLLIKGQSKKCKKWKICYFQEFKMGKFEKLKMSPMKERGMVLQKRFDKIPKFEN